VWTSMSHAHFYGTTILHIQNTIRARAGGPRPAGLSCTLTCSQTPLSVCDATPEWKHHALHSASAHFSKARSSILLSAYSSRAGAAIINLLLLVLMVCPCSLLGHQTIACFAPVSGLRSQVSVSLPSCSCLAAPAAVISLATSAEIFVDKS